MFVVSPAWPAELDVVLQLRDEASAWLRARGIDQWSRPWPSAEVQRHRIAASIAAGETWMVRDGPAVAATVAVDRHADPLLWTAAERVEPALYVHRLIVARRYASLGLGAWLLEWVAMWGTSRGDRWIRVDVWTDNIGLQRYYLDRGFDAVRTLAGDYPSGALLQRPL